jgi:hypothetical protein
MKSKGVSKLTSGLRVGYMLTHPLSANHIEGNCKRRADTASLLEGNCLLPTTLPTVTTSWTQLIWKQGGFEDNIILCYLIYVLSFPLTLKSPNTQTCCLRPQGHSRFGCRQGNGYSAQPRNRHALASHVIDIVIVIATSFGMLLYTYSKH